MTEYLTKGYNSKSIITNLSKVFDAFLLDSVDEVFFNLSEGAKVSIYFYIENKCKIRRCDIPQKIAEFSVALEQIFGLGTRFIEIMLMKNLHDKIGIVCDVESMKLINNEFSFQTYAWLMKRNFIEIGAGTSLNEGEIEVFVDTDKTQKQVHNY